MVRFKPNKKNQTKPDRTKSPRIGFSHSRPPELNPTSKGSGQSVWVGFEFNGQPYLSLPNPPSTKHSIKVINFQIRIEDNFYHILPNNILFILARVTNTYKTICKRHTKWNLNH